MRALGRVTVTAVAAFALAGYGAGHAATQPQPRHQAAEAPVSGPGETAFIKAVLADLHAPATDANVASVTAWIRHETAWPPAAANNPLDSTLPEPGSTAFNTVSAGVHVQNYPDAAGGAAATAATIVNGRYPRIITDLVGGAGLCGDAAAAADFATWSGNGYSAVC